jgi:NhaA family Na+:H+ antiporter
MAAIGFTMSLFITELAFESKEMALRAKVGILTASSIAMVLGLVILRFFTPDPEPEEEKE